MAEGRPGRAPGGAALLIVDMLNDLQFDGAEQLGPAARAIVEPILALRDAADAARVPVIYVNDNTGHWHADRTRLIEAIRDQGGAARDLVEALMPADHHYLVIKPRFSGFYATNMPVLLPDLQVDRLILTGVAADICVLFTAADAHMRGYSLWVPTDTVASEAEQRRDWALEIMAGSMSADTRTTGERGFDDWLDKAD